MLFKTEDDIYNYLYDPSIEDPDRYPLEAICVWVRATLHSAISQGIILGKEIELDRVIREIKQ